MSKIADPRPGFKIRKTAGYLRYGHKNDSNGILNTIERKIRKDGFAVWNIDGYLVSIGMNDVVGNEFVIPDQPEALICLCGIIQLFTRGGDDIDGANAKFALGLDVHLTFKKWYILMRAIETIGEEDHWVQRSSNTLVSYIKIIFVEREALNHVHKK